MKIIECKQGEPDWFKARCGIVTASELKNLVKEDFSPRTGQMPKTYLMNKLAEKWTGEAIYAGQSFAMGQGQLREGDPLAMHEFATGEEIERVGFITDDAGHMGCSPDGLRPDHKRGFEIKAPFRQTHLEYLLDGRLPPEYAPQVHGCLLVTQIPEWLFVSYCPGFPTFKMLVKADPEKMGRIMDAVIEFNGRLAHAYDRLLEINGGPPEPPTDISVATMPDVDPAVLEEFFNG